MSLMSWGLENKMRNNRKELLPFRDSIGKEAGEARRLLAPGGGWRRPGRLGEAGRSVVPCPLFVFYSLKASVTVTSGWPGDSVTLACPVTDYSWFSRMRSPSHGFVSRGQVPGALGSLLQAVPRGQLPSCRERRKLPAPVPRPLGPPPGTGAAIK